MKQIRDCLSASTMILAIFASRSLCAESEVPHLTVYGTAKIEIQPDVLHWTIAVTSRGGSPDEVAQRQDATVAITINTIKEIGIKSEDIQTSFTQLFENWEYRNSSSIMDGYKADTVIAFRCLNLELYRKLWLGLAKIPGVSIRSSDWDSSKRIALQEEARATALKSAQAKADSLAAVVNVTILEPISVSEIQADATSYQVNFLAPTGAREAQKNSVSPGTIEITARFEVIYRIGKK